MNPLNQKKAVGAEDCGGTKKPGGLLTRGSVPRLLKKSAGGESCCIFRIPHRHGNSIQNDYEPRVVSIGPYHHGKKHLEMIQEHKLGYLELFLAEAQKRDVEMKDLVEAVSLLEEDIMDSYSENLDLVDGFDRSELIDMMVLDGCFILMLFFVVAKEVQYAVTDDPIFRMEWILPAIRQDLLLLENQVPFFLLQTIFDKSKIVSSSGLKEITFEFFSCSFRKLDMFSLEHGDIKTKHLLDLVRKTFKPTLREEKQESVSSRRHDTKLIRSAKELHLVGIKFRARYSAKPLLDIEFILGTLVIPPIILDDFLISFLRNCVAFEQFYGDCSNPITSYIAFMGSLIRDKDDAELLTKAGIIDNYFGTSEEISGIFKDIGKDIFFDVRKSYLAEVFQGINLYASLQWNIYKAHILSNYLEGPKALLSFYSGTLLLILTMAQVYLAAYPYVYPPKGK